MNTHLNEKQNQVFVSNNHPTISYQPKAIPGTHRHAHRRQRWVLVATLILSDALMVTLALWLAWYLRIGSGLLIYNAPTDSALYRQVAVLAALLFVIVFAFIKLYDHHLLLGGPQEYGLVVAGCSYGILALIVVSFLFRNQPLSRGWLMLSWVLTIVLVGGARFWLRRVFFWMRDQWGWYITPTLIVGVSEHGHAITHQLSSQSAGVQIVGFLDEFLPVGTRVAGDLTVLGTPKQIHELAHAHEVEQIILPPNAVTWETFQDLMKHAGKIHGYEMHISPGFYEIATANVQVTHKAFVPLLRVEQARITGIDKILKLTLDFTLGSVLALISLPIMILIGGLILLTDGRPVFVRPQVNGLGGKPFRTLKFRTNLLGTSKRYVGHEIPQDIKVNLQKKFGVGCFLYRTGLDKLPQLFDVLRGCLSLVGPRTRSVDLDDEASSPLHPSLNTVKPGWTGSWAIRGSLFPEDEVRLDLYYIRNWTIWLDLQILFQTFKLVLFRRGRPTT